MTGCKKPDGYWLVGIEGTQYQAHRILWFLKTGEDPGSLHIDHKDGVKIDAAKVRKATASDNACNAGPRGDRKVKGVTLKTSGRYRAVIAKDNKDYHLGYFATLKEACDAYDEKARELHGEYAWLNLLQ